MRAPSLGFAPIVAAAMADPEPFSKTVLLIGSALATFGPMIARALNRGCGDTCIASSRIVDEIEPYLKRNVQNYLSYSRRTASMQAQSLALFDTAWAHVVAACSDPALGDAGRRCISERERNGRYPWVVYYRDPIANDPNVEPASIGSEVANTLGLEGPAADLLPLALLALLVILL